MKTKTEIRKQIDQFYELKKQARNSMRNNGYSLTQLDEPFQIIDYCILTLKWTLGYKIKYKGQHYWCFKCHLMHPEPTCPKCGGNKVMELLED